MAKFTPGGARGSHEVEVHDVNFSEEEWSRFRAASPAKFLKEISEANGDEVNHLLVDARLLLDDGAATIHRGPVTDS
ncbi:hypothetical protein [Streptomyces blastmyceticus]|uniref:Uncharacterized protein n=1 Tax=Streptomyces blastmyceticus TaxID=68180 RepID=A0ABP3HLY7_9ACTN